MSDGASGGADGNGLTPEEQGWLRTVPERVDPPPELRRRVIERLAAEGQLRTSTKPGDERRGRKWALAAALAAMFVAGAGLERAGVLPTSSMPPAADRATTADGARYVLLLHQGAAYDPGGRTGAELVEEYAAWAGNLAADGRLVLAEKLADDGVVVDGSGTEPRARGPSATGGEPGVLTGLFIIRASSYEEAARVARASPHARYGGAVVIRRVDPT